MPMMGTLLGLEDLELLLVGNSGIVGVDDALHLLKVINVLEYLRILQAHIKLDERR